MSIHFFFHPAICVSDPQRSLPFYRDILGFEVVGETHWEGPGPSTVMGIADAKFTCWQLRRDGQRLEMMYWHRPLSPAPDRPPQIHQVGLSHLTFFVDDAAVFAERMRSLGVVVREETWGSFLGPGGRPFFLMEDPDHIPIEIVQRPAGMPSQYDR